MFVGVDAHIDPAERTVFTEISGEFVIAIGAMCSIAPTKSACVSKTTQWEVLCFAMDVLAKRNGLE